jgi:hypothetical protein
MVEALRPRQSVQPDAPLVAKLCAALSGKEEKCPADAQKIRRVF